jgi:hypothetical protein
MAAGLMALPEVRAARVSVRLSGEVHVDVKEREPIFVWSNGGDAWLVDREGVLFARPGPEDLPAPAVPGSTGDDPATQDPEPGASVTPDATPPALDAPSGTGGDDAARSVLPMVEDARLARQAPDAGDRLGEVDLAVLRQLLALTPETIASASRSLRLRVDERDGYVLESMDLGWQALFGRYSPTLHPPDSIPRQVQCLAALLGDREDRVSRVWLVPSGSGCGTYLRIETTG